jgi:hypothetical protein
MMDKITAEQREAFVAAFNAGSKLSEHQKSQIERFAKDALRETLNIAGNGLLYAALGPVGLAMVHEATDEAAGGAYEQFWRDDYKSAEKRKERERKDQDSKIKEGLKKYLQNIAESKKVSESMQEELEKRAEEARAESESSVSASDVVLDVVNGDVDPDRLTLTITH